MAGTATNIIVGAATVKIGATTGAASDIGYTKGGTTVRYEPEFIDITADQAVGVVAKRRSNERLYVTTTVLEVTLARIQEAWGQPTSNLSSSTLTLGYNSSCNTPEVAIVLVGVSPGCGTRTFSFAKAIAMGTREYSMSREEETAFEVEFEVMKDANGNFGTIIDN